MPSKLRKIAVYLFLISFLVLELLRFTELKNDRRNGTRDFTRVLDKINHYLPNPVFTVKNSADNNPIHTTLSKSLYTQHAWRQTTAEQSLTAIVPQLDKCVKFMAFRRVILYSAQSFLSLQIYLNFRHLSSCDTTDLLLNCTK